MLYMIVLWVSSSIHLFLYVVSTYSRQFLDQIFYSAGRISVSGRDIRSSSHMIGSAEVKEEIQIVYTKSELQRFDSLCEGVLPFPSCLE